MLVLDKKWRVSAEDKLQLAVEDAEEPKSEDYEDPFGPLTSKEVQLLLQAGLDSRLYISYRMLADYLGMTKESLRVYKSRTGDSFPYTPITVGNNLFFNKGDILGKLPNLTQVPTLVQVPSTDYTKQEMLSTAARRKKKLEYTDALIETVDIVSWKKVVKRAVTDAQAGDAKARQWLSNYLIGLPVHRAEIDLNVTSERFSDAQRKEALYEMLGGMNGGSIVEASVSDSEETDGQTADGRPPVDATSK